MIKEQVLHIFVLSTQLARVNELRGETFGLTLKKKKKHALKGRFAVDLLEK